MWVGFNGVFVICNYISLIISQILEKSESVDKKLKEVHLLGADIVKRNGFGGTAIFTGLRSKLLTRLPPHSVTCVIKTIQESILPNFVFTVFRFLLISLSVCNI